MSVNPERVRVLADGGQTKGPVVYWMSRDQRAKDNWALIYAQELARRAGIPCYEADAHNIVPCWLASTKQEWAAYTFRPKIHRLLHGFLHEFPALRSHPVPWKGEVENDWAMAERSIRADVIPEAPGIEPGEAAAARILGEFIEQKLSHYDSERNDPNRNGQSHLSPYLHFGQIAAQRVALKVLPGKERQESAQAFSKS